MVQTEPIRVEGLREFGRKLKTMETGLTRELRLALNEAAQLVVDDAKPKIPTLTGRAAGSVRVSSTQREVRVKAGGAKVAYYPWLDFGGRVGRKKSVVRPFFTDGRYLFLSYKQLKESGRILDTLQKALRRLADRAGIEMT
jgi:hypothetical protein